MRLITQRRGGARDIPMLMVCITGMPGAGKSTAAKALVARGWKRMIMGDVIREETRKRGLEPDEKNTGEVMRSLRKKYGDAAVAELCVKKLSGSGSDKVVVDGIRSMAEVEAFRRGAKVLLIAVHASPTRRYALLKERGRTDDPLSFEMFLRRDERELEVGMGEAIAMADEVISNEHSTPESLSARVLSIAEGWVKALGEQ
jgi:dephospho-CoA kinase